MHTARQHLRSFREIVIESNEELDRDFTNMLDSFAGMRTDKVDISMKTFTNLTRFIQRFCFTVSRVLVRVNISSHGSLLFTNELRVCACSYSNHWEVIMEDIIRCSGSIVMFTNFPDESGTLEWKTHLIKQLDAVYENANREQWFEATSYLLSFLSDTLNISLAAITGTSYSFGSTRNNNSLISMWYSRNVGGKENRYGNGDIRSSI